MRRTKKLLIVLIAITIILLAVMMLGAVGAVLMSDYYSEVADRDDMDSLTLKERFSAQFPEDLRFSNFVQLKLPAGLTIVEKYNLWKEILKK